MYVHCTCIAFTTCTSTCRRTPSLSVFVITNNLALRNGNYRVMSCFVIMSKSKSDVSMFCKCANTRRLTLSPDWMTLLLPAGGAGGGGGGGAVGGDTRAEAASWSRSSGSNVEDD